MSDAFKELNDAIENDLQKAYLDKAIEEGPSALLDHGAQMAKEAMEIRRNETNAFMKAIPILVENPLANYPDTDDCLCGSGHIWRRCHKSQMISMIPKDEAEKVQAFMDLKAKGKT